MKQVSSGDMHRARVLAIQALYAQEQQGRLSEPKATSSTFTEGPTRTAQQTQHSKFPAKDSDVLLFAWLDQEPFSGDAFVARNLFIGTCEHLAEIDGMIQNKLQNWTLDRLLAVDRAILRLGVYTLLFLHDTPIRVILDECIELAHRFAGEQSYRLINGVLDAVAKELNPELKDFKDFNAAT